MPPRPYILAETDWKTVKNTDYQVAILPWGATEAHNYHMPYATDNYQVDHLAAEAARLAWEQGEKVVALPCVPFGVNAGQMDIKFDLNMNPSTQALVLRDLVEALSKQGIPKLVVLNGHGGNDFKQMLRELQPQFPNVFLSTISWYNAVNPADYFEDTGDHAGETETSMMLHIAPDLVLPLSEAGDGSTNAFKLKGIREGWAWAQREWSKATNDTGVGDPKLATAEKGEAYIDSVTKKMASYFVELAQCDIHDLYE